MFGQSYYFSLIRKYVTIIGSLFDNINITRTDSNGNPTTDLTIPVTYSSKDKMLARVIGDPGIDRLSENITLPIIAFELGPMRYDASRKLNTVNKVAYKKDANNFKFQYEPVPYNFDFEVSLLYKNNEDATKVIEQILPYFTPDWTVTLKLIPEMEEIRDIPIILNSVSHQEKDAEGSLLKGETKIYIFSLTLKGYLYGPINKAPIIKVATTNFVSGNTIAAFIQIKPGMTANGTATTNSSITVPENEIEITDDYGFIITKG